MEEGLEPATLAAEVTEWDRPLSRQGMPFARARYHQAFPLGSAEGRALAERMFGGTVINALDRDRYGSPAGWLHTYSSKWPYSGHTLDWAFIGPDRTSALFDAYVLEWRQGRTHTTVLREVMGAGADLLPAGVVDNWQVALAVELELPGINARWDA